MKYLSLLILFLPHITAADSVETILRKAEVKYKFPTGLLTAMASVESGLNHKAFVEADGVGGRSSFGLLQVQLGSARQVGFKDSPQELMKHHVNVEYAAKYLDWLLKTHENDLAWALVCFNAGPNSKLCKNKRTTPYISAVLNAWKGL